MTGAKLSRIVVCLGAVIAAGLAIAILVGVVKERIWIYRLKSGDDGVRRLAIKQLGEYGTSRCLTALIEMLRASMQTIDLLEVYFDTTDNEAALAIRKCLRLGQDELLRRYANDVEPYIALWAVCNMAVRNIEYGQILEDRLGDALAQDDQELKFFAAELCALSNAAARLPDSAIRKVETRLYEDSLDTRQCAAIIIGAMGPRAAAAIPGLVDAVRRMDGGVPYAAEALGKMGRLAQSAVPVLTEALNVVETPGVEKAIRVALEQIRE